MRKVDESRVANYIRKHSNYKKWLAFVLCLSLLTGTITLYILNKPATAMTAEGADSLGVILDTLDSEGEAELIQDTLENKLAVEGEGSGEGGDGNLFDLGQGSGNNGEDGDDGQNVDDAGDDGQDGDDAANLGDTEETKDGQKSDDTALTEDKAAAEATSDEENKEETTEEDELTQDVVLTVSYVDENGESIADDKELSIEESFDPSNEAPSIDGYTFKEATVNGDVITKVAVKKNADDIRYYEVTFDNDETKEIKKDGSVVLTYTAEEEDLVLTASYVDEDGKEIAEEEELEISESFDPKNDSDVIEGYTFKEAKIDEDVVVLITAKEDEESGEKFYEATLEDESVVEIKEDTTIILTYAAVDTTVVLTAKFVDRNGEEFQESKDLNIGDETELKKSKITEVDGYFFYKAIYEEKEITKIAPIFEEEKKDTDKDDAETETESKAEESDEESAAVKATGYKFTTVDGEEIEITDDAEIEFSYLKASTETEFTFEDSKVSVKATVNGKNVFPEGIELKAVEVTKDSSSYNYDAYMDALNQNAEAIANEAGKDNADEFTEDNTLLYDIAFAFEEKEIQPKEGTVSVKIEFKKNQLSEDISASSEEDIAVVHLPIKEEVKEENEIVNTDDAGSISSSDIDVKTLMDATARVEATEKVEFVSDSFSIFAVVSYMKHDAGTDNFLTVLGDAVNFGIVTDELTLSESDSNFAAATVRGASQTGNKLTNNVEQTFLMGKVINQFQIKNKYAYVIVPSDYANSITLENPEGAYFDYNYTETQLQSIVGDMLQYVRDASADLATRPATAKIKNVAKNDNEYIGLLDISGDNYASGTHYVTIDNDSIKSINGKATQPLTIRKRSDQTIVFNVTATGNLTIIPFKLSVDGSSDMDTTGIANQAESPYPSSIIWNFINADSVTTQNGPIGVFISGKTDAVWKNDGTSAGWLVFPKVTIGNGEWHNNYGGVVKIGSTAQMLARKTIDGKDATVTGFKFSLYTADGSTLIETVTNNTNAPNKVEFSPISYGSGATNYENHYQHVDPNGGEFVYKIVETQGAEDANGNKYVKDSTEYYAKVTVKVEKKDESTSHSHVKGTYYWASKPLYYTDAACTQPLIYYKDDDPTKPYDGFPVFNNATQKKEFKLHLDKKVNNEAASKEEKFVFSISRLKDDILLDTDNGWFDYNTTIKNISGNIDYIINAQTWGIDFDKQDYYYFRILEDRVDESTDTSQYQYSTDSSWVIAKLDKFGEVTYYKLDGKTDRAAIEKAQNDPKLVRDYCIDKYAKSGANVFFNYKKTFLTVIKEWTLGGKELKNAGYQPIYIKVYRSYNGISKGIIDQDLEDGKELVKWTYVSKGVYLDTTDSGEGLEYLPISQDTDWQVKLYVDRLYPQNTNRGYWYYVKEYEYVDKEYKEKTDLVTYTSYAATDTDWKNVHAGIPTEDSSFTLTITNELGGNVLPSTGGTGDIPYMATGLGTAVAGLVGAKAYNKKKKKDDEE